MEAGRAPKAPFEIRISAQPPSLSVLRHAFGRWLGSTPVEPSLVGDLVLAASELGAAAMRVVGPGGLEQHVLVRSWLDDGALVIEVTDDPAPGTEGPDLDGLYGADASRGLSIVATLTDVLTIRAGERGMLMRARKEHAADDGFGPTAAG